MTRKIVAKFGGTSIKTAQHMTMFQKYADQIQN